MSAVVGALALLCLSCADRTPLEPDPADALLASAVAGPVFERGCARFEVRVAGKDRVEVQATQREECGPVQPVLSGTPTFDRTKQTVRLPLALENTGKRKVKAPAWLLGWEDSLAVVSAPGLAKNGHTHTYLGLVAPDSVAEAADTVLRGARIWKYDRHLAAAGEPQTLATGERSGVRWVEVSVHAGVESFRVTLHARARRASNPVPAVAPDTVPQWISDPWTHAPEKIDTSGTIVSAPILRDVVEVIFVYGTPQPDRQRAVDAVGGEVIGGLRLPGVGDGFYFVQLPVSTPADLEAAINALLTAPGVQSAGVYLIEWGIGVAHRRPRDGAGFDAWAVLDTLASGRNWGLEAISAPLAWGCEVGDAGRRPAIGIVDNGFHTAAQDLFRNVTHSVHPNVFASRDHGNAVASVAGAHGNDTTGITGAAWNADLRLYEIATDSSGTPQYEKNGDPALGTSLIPRLSQAIRNGSRVINLSLGKEWAHTPQSKEDSVVARRVADRIVSTIRLAESSTTNRPLYVIAAGNENRDAFWSAFPAIADSIPTRVIVVGAIENRRSGTAWRRWSRSNTGSLVHIAAPGHEVYALDKAGTPGAYSGTSLAAPHVTGAAGLLLAFDSTLSAETVRAHLVSGARNGTRVSSDGIPVLNAYESLRLAAGRPGAPLCGNRVWISGGKAVSRRAGSGGAELETLFPVAGKVSGVNVLHGGRRIRYFDHASWKSRVYALRDGAWRDLPSTDPEYVSAMKEYGPSYVSLWNVSHDRDTVAYTRDGEVRLRERSTGKDWLLTKIPIGSSSSFTEECIAASEPDKCWSHWGGREKVLVGSRTSSQLNPGVGYSPMGDVIYVGWAQGRDWTRLASDWYSLEEEIEVFGVPKWFRKWESGGAITHGRVYEISIATGEKRVVVEGSDAVFENVAVAEGGRELALLRRRQSGAGRYEWTWNPDDKSLYLTTTSLGFVMECRSQYHDARDGSTLQVLDTCEFSATTFSPDRSPGAGPLVSR